MVTVANILVTCIVVLGICGACIYWVQPHQGFAVTVLVMAVGIAIWGILLRIIGNYLYKKYGIDWLKDESDSDT